VTPRATVGTGSGRRKTVEYTALHAAKQRCFNQKNPKHKDYGARGVTVCARWLGRGGFANFLADVGPRPGPTYSLDRKEVNGNYEPGNVRWATPGQQSDNKRNNRFPTVRLEPELQGLVKAAAASQGLTVRQLVNDALRCTIAAVAYGASRAA